MTTAESHYDHLWNRICDEEEEVRAAEEMGMTLQQYRAHCARMQAEAAIDKLEWSRLA